MSRDVDVKEWVVENLRRGHSKTELIQELMRRGIDPNLASIVVESASLLAPVQAWTETYSTDITVGSASAQSAGASVIREEVKPTAPVEGTSVPPHKAGDTSSHRPSPYDIEPSRIKDAHVIQTSDREIRVLARLKRPDLVLFENVLSSDECDELIEISQPRMIPSAAVDHDQGVVRIMPERISEGTYFMRNTAPLITRIDQRIAELTAWPAEKAEAIQVLKYNVGGEYRPHWDYFPPDKPGSEAQIGRGGQRIATLIIYLNDVEQGGATVFPKIGLSISPRKGNGLYFSYYNSKGQFDDGSYHAGAPVISGQKWIASKWLRQYFW